jgi:hypothetical protein
MSEANFWRDLQPIFSSFGKAQRIETPVSLGVPDVCYVLTWRGVTASGWVELKWLPRFPVKPETAVVIDHLTKDQVLWQESWAAAGGRVCTLLKVGKITLAMTPAVTRAVHERRLTEKALLGAVAPRLAHGIPVNMLMEWLVQ